MAILPFFFFWPLLLIINDKDVLCKSPKYTSITHQSYVIQVVVCIDPSLSHQVARLWAISIHIRSAFIMLLLQMEI